MTLYLNRCNFPVTSLGFGMRVGIWVQGCSIGCRGCVVPETWKIRPEHAVELGALVRAVEPWLNKADGVTISGGEPFEQPEALEVLIAEIRSRSAGDVLVYSGFTAASLRRRFATIMTNIDVLISEPFIAGLRDDDRLRGSSNQQIHLLTPLAHRRYTEAVLHQSFANVAVDGDSIRLAGVLPKGALIDIQRTLRTAGFSGRLTHEPPS